MPKMVLLRHVRGSLSPFLNVQRRAFSSSQHLSAADVKRLGVVGSGQMVEDLHCDRNELDSDDLRDSA